MSVTLLALGIVMALAGIAAAGFGIPINEFSFVIAGTTALTGGLILIGLSAVVSELGRVAEGLRARPTPTRPVVRQVDAEQMPPLQAPAPPAVVAASARPLQEVIPAPAPPPRPRPEVPASRELRSPEPPPLPSPVAPSTVDVSAAAIERLRSSIPRSERVRGEPSAMTDSEEEVPLSPNGGALQPPAGAPRREAPEPRVIAEDRVPDAATETLKSSRLDFLFRAKSRAAAPQPQTERFDAYWPADARQTPRHPPAAQAQPRPAQIERQPEAAVPAPERHAERPPAEEPRSAAAVLKSGVVDGMAYTLYADGSIEAKLPHGTVRFGSIAELRAHIESNT